MTRPLTLLPAIDVKDGQSVRITQTSIETTFGSPLEQAQEFLSEGASWIHLVDLNAAYNSGNNAELLRTIISSLGISVQLSGGIADEVALNRSLEMNPARINISSGALGDLAWVCDVVQKYGEKIAVALDVAGGRIAPRGAASTGFPDLALADVLFTLDSAGCARVVITDVAKDGSLAGPNLDLLTFVRDHSRALVVASGGVATLADIDDLRALEIDGAIIGKALYAGALSFPEALKRAGGA